MRILVTGGSGFIGSHVVDKLVKEGHAVRVIDIMPPYQGDIEFLEGDITSRQDVMRSIVDIDIVYHIAAFSNIDLVKANPLATIEKNIMGTAYLLEECRRQGIKRFIFASTVYVYDETGHLYTTSKLASELLCKNYHTLYSLPYTILRYGTAYGPRSRGADVISLFVNRVLKGENLIIRGSGRQTRHFTYVEDLAAGSVAALKPIAENKTYTLAGREAISIEQLAEMIRRTCNNNIDITFQDAREDDHREVKFELDTASSELGWKPVVELEGGIRLYVKWLKRGH